MMSAAELPGRTMDELIVYRQGLLFALEEVVSKLTEIVRITSPKDWHRTTGSNKHTPHAILVHLWLLEAKQFALYIRRIYDQDMPLLPSFDDASWMRSYYKPKEKPGVILREFAELRQMEINWLRQLPPEAWSRMGRHPKWGEHTLQWWVELQLEYSHQHLDELSSTLKA